MAKRTKKRTRQGIETSSTSRNHPCAHPGEVLRASFMEPLGLNAAAVAKGTGISAMHIGRILKATNGITAETALRLARFLGTSPEEWMELQVRFDLETAIRLNGRQIERTTTPHRPDHA